MMAKSNLQTFQPISQETEQVGKQILDAAFKVHSSLGPGLLESVYEKALAYDLENQGLFVETQKQIPIKYDDLLFESGFFCDLFIEKRVIVELKAVETLIPLFKLNY